LPRESEDRRRGEDLAWAQNGRRKCWPIGRVRKVLRLERQAIALTVGAAARAGDRAIEIAGGVDLDPRFGCPNCQGATALFVSQGYRFHEGRIPFRSVEHEVMVIPSTDDELRMAIANAGADPVRRPKVKRRASYWGQLSGRRKMLIDLRVAAGRYLQEVV